MTGYIRTTGVLFALIAVYMSGGSLSNRTWRGIRFTSHSPSLPPLCLSGRGACSGRHCRRSTVPEEQRRGAS